MRRPSKPAVVARHPDWCASDRCGYLVPPLMPHMARRHRSSMHQVGDKRAGGLIATYLIGSDALGAMVGIHATCRGGNGWAELSLPQATELVDQLHRLLAQAADDQETNHE